MIDITPEIFGLLVLAAFVSGFIDSIAGGGGLVAVPALLMTGMNPVTALATNKLQALFGSGMAMMNYARKGHVNLKTQWRAALLSFGGSVGGAFLVSSLPVDTISLVLPVLLLGVTLFFAIKPGIDDLDRVQRMTPLVFMLMIVPLIGFYDGLIGPGTGAFFMIAFVSLAGYGVLKATAHTKVMNFASNVGGALALMQVSEPVWALGFAMGAAQLTGAFIGSQLAMVIGSRLIKPLLVVTSAVMGLKLVYDAL